MRPRPLAGVCAVVALVTTGCGDSGDRPEAGSADRGRAEAEGRLAAAKRDTASERDAGPSGRATITVTDVAGRQVEVAAPVERMLFGQARLIYMTALLDRDDPSARLAGWPDDLRTADPDAYDAYAAEFPGIADIPEIGAIGKGAFSNEAAIALEPDVFVVPLSMYESAVELNTVDVLESAGVPTVVIDFHDHPLDNTVPSARLLGRIMGREAEAEAFADFYDEQVELVTSRLASPPLAPEDRPAVFLYRAAGLLECCATFGDSNLGDLVEVAGGANLGSTLLPGAEGVLNPEAVLDADPDVIVATGANWKNQEDRPGVEVGFVSLGYAAEPGAAATQLAGLTTQPGWDTLAAVRTKRFHGVWHQFYTSPYNFAALLSIAKWLHPARFDDIDPQAVFGDFHDRFLPVDLTGTFWTSLP